MVNPQNGKMLILVYGNDLYINDLPFCLHLMSNCLLMIHDVDASCLTLKF